VVQLLKYYTWLDRAEIDRLARVVGEDPSARVAQRRLAEEVTRIVHGEALVAQVQADAALRFGGAVTAESLRQVVPAASVSSERISSGLAVTELMVIAGLSKSKSEAFRLIEQGGVSINDQPVTDPRAAVSIEQALGNRFKVAKGKRSVAVVEVTQ
jgi:tyrosyl-tRNA synthetase